MRLSSLFATSRALLLCLVVSVFAQEEIRVELSSHGDLYRLYVSNFVDVETDLSPKQLKALRSVFLNDINHSGFLQSIDSDEKLDGALKKSDPAYAFSKDLWGKSGCSYVVKLISRNSSLDAFVFSVNNGKLKRFADIPLTGDLAQDRRKMHKLSDAVVKELFGKKGIANSRILYAIQTEGQATKGEKWRSEIWECDWDGKNARQVTYEHTTCITPVMIPPHPTQGSDRFLYVNYTSGQPKIYYSTLKNRKGRPLIDLRGNQLLPAISRDRNKVAFVSDAGGRADLFIQEVTENGEMKGKPQQIFSYPRSTQGSPTFSPDGSRIAFVSDIHGSPRIYIIPTDYKKGKRPEPILITKRCRENICPSWSPDGTKIAYSAKTNGIRQIWIYDLELEEEKQLTTGPGNKENPCWAKDSLHLVFNSTDPDSSELFVINLHQPEALQITSGPGKKHYPTWETR